MEQTQTVITMENGKVVIRHSLPVGTQWLEPQQAREVAAVLIEQAKNAEIYLTRVPRHRDN